jgi:hypothetical protein
MALNHGRALLGGVVGGVVWTAWSFLVNLRVGQGRYEAMQAAGLFLKQPRYPAFMVQWIVLLFVLALIVSYFYAWVRPRLGPGPYTAMKVGALFGFAAGFPGNFGQAAWSPVDRVLPLAWMLEMWIGAIFAAIVAGWLYKEAA